ncbi:unnamed protein product, partial [Rotaria sp. Silwood2]
KMVDKLEILPNEILISILSYFSWDELLTYFWSLNKRFNFLICSIISLNENGIIISKPGLSYRKVLSKLFPLIYKSSSLRSSVRHIHLDGTNSNCYSLIYQCSYKNRNIIHYPNLKSLILNRFCLSKLLIEYLSLLIQYQLEKLVLTVDEDALQSLRYEPMPFNAPSKGNFLLL